MEKEFFLISLTIYSAFFVFFMCFEIYSYMKFKTIVKENDAALLLDILYEISIYSVGFLYLAMYVSGLIDTFSSLGLKNQSSSSNSMDSSWINLKEITFLNRNSPDKMIPIMVITFRILVNEGLYAYNYKKLYIGKDKVFNLEDVKIKTISEYSHINRAKIIVSIKKATEDKEKRYVIRTSINKLQSLIGTIKSD